MASPLVNIHALIQIFRVLLGSCFLLYISWTLASLAENQQENFEANINVEKCLPF